MMKRSLAAPENLDRVMLGENKMKTTLNRRRFISGSGLGLLGMALPARNRVETPQSPAPAAPAKIKEFRTLGRTGFSASDISSGGPMDAAVLRALLNAGVNYIDTAESYGRGQSERVTGTVVKEFDRKKLFITTKLVIKKETTKEEVLNRYRQCLERLQMDYVDCLMIHSAANVDIVKSAAFHDAAKQLKDEGTLRFVGISNHGSQWDNSLELDPMDTVLLAAAEDGRFDVMLLVYNFLQKEMGEKILQACREKKIGTTLMKTNPVGGYLEMKERVELRVKEGKAVPENLARVLASLKEKADAAETFIKQHHLQNPLEIKNAAIRFVLSNPDVHSVCCSCENFGDVESFLALSGSRFGAADKNKLTLFQEGCSTLYCRHACGACESACPSRVPVNTIMRYNHYFEAQGRQKHAMQKYAQMPTAKADLCSSCAGHCEKNCPYQVPVQGLLTLAHQQLQLG